MSALFHHAMRYEWVGSNPIKLVRQSAKRERIPDVLELSEIQLLLSKLELRERTLVLLDAATGLRVSESLALRWEGVDFKTVEAAARCFANLSAPQTIAPTLNKSMMIQSRVSIKPRPLSRIFRNAAQALAERAGSALLK